MSKGCLGSSHRRKWYFSVIHSNYYNKKTAHFLPSNTLSHSTSTTSKLGSAKNPSYLGLIKNRKVVPKALTIYHPIQPHVGWQLYIKIFRT